MKAALTHRLLRYGFALFFCASGAWAANIEGKVIGVADGDTLTVLQDRRQFKIRLAEIDAPEHAQPFGQRSKQSLSDICFGRPARVENKGTDRYGRIIGRVWCSKYRAAA